MMACLFFFKCDLLRQTAFWRTVFSFCSTDVAPIQVKWILLHFGVGHVQSGRNAFVSEESATLDPYPLVFDDNMLGLYVMQHPRNRRRVPHAQHEQGTY